MRKNSVVVVGLAVLLGTRLAEAQAADSTPTAAPTKPPAAAPGAPPAAPPPREPAAPSASEAKPAASAADPGAAAPPDAAAPPLPSTAKQRAIQLQRRRIADLSARIDATETAAKRAPAAPPAEQSKVEAAVAEDRAKRSAAATTLAVLEGASVTPETAKSALAIERRENEALKSSLGAAAAADLEASETSMAALEKAAAPGAQPPNKNIREVQFPKGDLLHYGPTVSLLRVSALRNPGEPGRHRNYEGRYEFVPAEFGFQFLFAPHNQPWRYQLASGKSFQLLSAGGMLLARIDKDDVQRGNLSLAATLSLFEEIIGLGVGVDLYRGVPVQGADGQSGSDTAFTGLLAWSLMRRGEVTPENVFFVVTLGLEPLVRSVTGEL